MTRTLVRRVRSTLAVAVVISLLGACQATPPAAPPAAAAAGSGTEIL